MLGLAAFLGGTTGALGTWAVALGAVSLLIAGTLGAVALEARDSIEGLVPIPRGGGRWPEPADDQERNDSQRLTRHDPRAVGSQGPWLAEGPGSRHPQGSR